MYYRSGAMGFKYGGLVFTVGASIVVTNVSSLSFLQMAGFYTNHGLTGYVSPYGGEDCLNSFRVVCAFAQ